MFDLKSKSPHANMLTNVTTDNASKQDKFQNIILEMYLITESRNSKITKWYNDGTYGKSLSLQDSLHRKL